MNEKSSVSRLPLAERLRIGLEETLDWAMDNGTSMITEYADGKLLEPKLLTRDEWESERTERNFVLNLDYTN